MWGDQDSSTAAKPSERWDKFLNKVEETDNLENVLIMGDFNINLEEDSTDNDPLNNLKRKCWIGFH